ncbi:DMT family transporter [Xenorhabdus sp. BG5]|uniref:DMT family transporter n=1 Tax=Xenorhabdus sp. BG5 TaxID=2782014 RepID=UPI00188038C6|nr:DMT family transporter [Xenorhabdus sp. BG5]MBE8598131.1 EamA family transporter [Xenorhabdus sp. BG5]
MNRYFFKRAEFYALTAAALNGTIGVFTYFGLNSGISHSQVAFWKCFIAFLVLLIYCLVIPSERHILFTLRNKSMKFSLLAFFGIFCLYFFETWAFKEASVPLVSFLTYAAGGITLLLSSLFLGEKIGINKCLSFIMIMIGVYFFFSCSEQTSSNYKGILLALLAGLGYALFIFLSKLMKIGSGLSVLVWLFGFGSIYLAIPLIQEELYFPSGIALLTILALVFLPSIGGFYFTTKALEKGEASNVQIIETSDPLFSTLFAFLFINESLGWLGFIGAFFIMSGLLISIKTPNQAKLSS